MDNINKEKIKNFTLDLLFPKFCFGCQKEGEYLCSDCRHLLEILDHSYCLCEKNPSRLFDNKIGKCEKCQNKDILGLYFALPYKDNHLIQKMILNFKYEPFIKELDIVFAKILAEHFILSNKNTNDIWDNSVLLPVPLFIKKQKKRGYNQSEEIAKKLSEIINVPVILNILIKIKNTPSQAGLKKEEREKNILKSFKIQNIEKIKNKKVFLIDDVYTTGSTIKECAKTLKSAGIKNIWAICIARENL